MIHLRNRYYERSRIIYVQLNCVAYIANRKINYIVCAHHASMLGTIYACKDIHTITMSMYNINTKLLPLWYLITQKIPTYCKCIDIEILYNQFSNCNIKSKHKRNNHVAHTKCISSLHLPSKLNTKVGCELNSTSYLLAL